MFGIFVFAAVAVRERWPRHGNFDTKTPLLLTNLFDYFNFQRAGTTRYTRRLAKT